MNTTQSDGIREEIESEFRAKYPHLFSRMTEEEIQQMLTSAAEFVRLGPIEPAPEPTLIDGLLAGIGRLFR